MKTDKEQELLKKIAYHEVYSTAYKIQFAKQVLVRGAKATGKAAVVSGKFIKKKLDEKKLKKEIKKAAAQIQIEEKQDIK
ncbi:MAG TPA: hypothetical protein DCS67_01205 [Clostridiales bacterium UBA8960]|nr:hypothetical protein [Clostridiales bacterium UBA8960]